MAFSTQHIQYLTRDDLDASGLERTQLAPWRAVDPATLHLVRITSVPRPPGGLHPHQTAHARMAEGLTGVHGLSVSSVLVFRGTPTAVELYVGCGQHAPGPLALEPSLLVTLCQSMLPGIECVPLTADEQRALQQDLLTLGQGALVTGTPAVDTEADAHGSLGDPTHMAYATTPLMDRQLDRLIRMLWGGYWAYVVVAMPVTQSEIQSLTSMTLNELRLVANAEQSVRSTPPLAEHYKQLLTVMWHRLQTGKAQGMWHNLAYLLARDGPTLQRAQAISRAIFSGLMPSPDPIRVLAAPGLPEYVAAFALPLGAPPQAPGQFRYPYGVLSLLHSTELSMMLHFPTQEVPGFFVRSQPPFDVTPQTQQGTEPWLEVGEIMQQGRPTGVPYGIAPSTLPKHLMVCGTTGSGKTNLVFHLLRQFTILNKPWLVIEPAKMEYRALLALAHELGQQVRVFTLGNELLGPFRLNPFESPPGIPVQTHLDRLKGVFNSSFTMYAPMPEVLEACLHEIYVDKGWDLVTSINRREHHARAFPTLSDLYNKIDTVVDRLGYEERINSNIKAALKVRINSLRLGGKGLMLDTHVSFPIASLLEAPTILELNDLGDDDEKAFLMGLILLDIYEHYQAQGHTEHPGVQHLTVIEEAHRLLKATPAVVDPEMASMAQHAVEAFCTMLAEIRAYGEGIVVVEQIPSKLAPEILKLTNLKIAHRLVAEDDRELLGGAMCAYPEQRRWLGTLRVGEAVVFGGGDDNPLFVRVPYRKLPSSTTSRQQDAAVQEAMAACLTQYAPVYTPYPWASLDGTCWRTYRAEARAIVEQPEFQEEFARYVQSSVVMQDALLTEFPRVAQTVRKYTRHTRGDALLDCTLVVGIDWLLETRGQQSGAGYAEVEQLKHVLATLLATYVLPRWRGADPLPVSAEHVTNIQTWQHEYARLFASHTVPFVGCAQVCGATRACLYRYHVTPMTRDPRFNRNFVNALAQTTGSAPYQQVAEVCRMATRRLLAAQVSEGERCQAALCLAIQASETIPTLDYDLKQKLMTGILPFLTPSQP